MQLPPEPQQALHKHLCVHEAFFFEQAEQDRYGLGCDVPISLKEQEYNDLLLHDDPELSGYSMNLEQKITDEGWGLSPIHAERVSDLEKNRFVQTKTWTLRLIKNETVCIPLERQVVRNEADNNSERVFPLEWNFSTSSFSGDVFMNVQLVQKQFEYDEIFSTHLKVKSLMAPFLVVVETEQTPTLEARLSWQQFSTKSLN